MQIVVFILFSDWTKRVGTVRWCYKDLPRTVRVPRLTDKFTEYSCCFWLCAKNRKLFGTSRTICRTQHLSRNYARAVSDWTMRIGTFRVNVIRFLTAFKRFYLKGTWKRGHIEMCNLVFLSTEDVLERIMDHRLVNIVFIIAFLLSLSNQCNLTSYDVAFFM